MGLMSKEDIEKLKQQLKVQGYKLTPQRRAILDVIIENEGKHLSTEEVYDIVKDDCPEIGLATVYRTLQLLEKMGVLCKMNFDDGCNRYELVHNDEDHQHHHLVCISCGKVEEAEDDLLEKLEEKVEDLYKFRIVNHSVKFFGYCSSCSENLKK
ncbi:Fur family transcriptional regulator [Fervidicella metallireducens AeB]|uniref:Fur family transcriptional regulator n=1 Tax=Fervidicella metallireducens AeB TaxID=1403537 RepID=A0A017RYM2_9CLOT|nr:Fur family transcriptional regulator [Fervidicella metallireducens]EYE89671.1 Fur family transcriptional regulator [Fervidicella metallireducens AeB]